MSTVTQGRAWGPPADAPGRRGGVGRPFRLKPGRAGRVKSTGPIRGGLLKSYG